MGDDYEQYCEHRAEMRAQGCEAVSYEEWKGEYNREQDVQEYWKNIWDNDEQDLY